MARVKLSPEQKRANKIERKRKALEDRNYKEVGGRGSLFAALAEPVTAEQAEWHQRRTRAEMIEHLHWGPAGKVSHALATFNIVTGIEVEARRLLGDEWFGKLLAYCRRTFRSSGHWYGFWCKVLAGDGEVTLSLKKVNDPTSSIGFRCVPAEAFPPPGWLSPMTKAEFYERWPYKEPDLGPEPESADPLFDEIMAKLKAA